MRKYVYLILSLCVIIACQDVKKPERPENLIPMETMVEVMTDAYLSNAARSINNRLIRREGIKLDTIIYKKHKIDSIQFVKSHAYYTTNLNSYQDLFTKVEANLLKIQIENDSLKARERRRQDSLLKLRQDSIKSQRNDTLEEELPPRNRRPVTLDSLVLPIQDTIE